MLTGGFVRLHLIEQCGEGGFVVVVGSNLHPGGRGDVASAIGLRDAGKELQRLLVLTPNDQQLSQTGDGILVAGFDLQRSAERTLSTLGQQGGHGILALGGHQRIDELLHEVLGQRPHETVDDCAVLQRVDGRNRLHLKRLRDSRVLVGVDLHQHHLAAGRVDHLLDDGAERAARATPWRPQIDNHRHVVRTVDDFGLEGCVGDIGGHGGHDIGNGRYRTEAMSPVQGIDVAAVSEWLQANVVGAIGPFTFDVIAGGHSNLTFTVTGTDGNRFVLRRPPLGHVLASAHDMGREHRIISGLQKSAVPVAPALGFCDDLSVNEAPFYVMGFVDGHVLRDRAVAEAVLSPDARRVASESLVDTMVAIHSVDLDIAGLNELGRHEGYIARQLKRWYGQWNQQQTRALLAVDRVHDELLRRIPEQGPATIVHGDYRLDNCMVGDDGRVVAVLDWEICTLGDPLADLGLLQVYWTGPNDVASAWTGSATTAPGFYDRAQLADRYAQVSGRDVTNLPFYVSFAYWKLACILEGVYARYLGGALGARDAAELNPFKLQVEAAAASAEQMLEQLP